MLIFVRLSLEKVAMESDRFADEIIPVAIKNRKGNETVIDKDEYPRAETTLDKLNNLRPIFEDGTVTAGNATGINDGASGVILMSAELAKKIEFKTIGQIHRFSHNVYWSRTRDFGSCRKCGLPCWSGTLVK